MPLHLFGYRRLLRSDITQHIPHHRACITESMISFHQQRVACIVDRHLLRVWHGDALMTSVTPEQLVHDANESENYSFKQVVCGCENVYVVLMESMSTTTVTAFSLRGNVEMTSSSGAVLHVLWCSEDHPDLRGHKFQELSMFSAMHVLFLICDTGALLKVDIQRIWNQQVEVNEMEGKIAEERVTNVTCGGSYAIALCESGHAFGYGNNTKCQLGIEDMVMCPDSFILIEALCEAEIGVKKVACGISHTLFLTNQGDVYGCGEVQWLGIGESACSNVQFQSVPTLIESFVNQREEQEQLENVTDIAAGHSHSVFLRGVQLLGTGSNKYGQLNREPSIDGAPDLVIRNVMFGNPKSTKIHVIASHWNTLVLEELKISSSKQRKLRQNKE